MISSFKDHLAYLESNYHQRVGARDRLVANITQAELKKAELLNQSGDYIYAVELLSEVSSQAREQAKSQLERIVTEALQYITEDSTYQFLIELSDNGGKPTCEFYVTTEINGEVSKQKPENACGGGFVDIISTTLRYAYLHVFNDPVIMNQCVILDEPGKMVSELASEKFAGFLRYLGETFNKQTIMVTHNENLMTSANKTFEVMNQNNQSKVKEERHV